MRRDTTSWFSHNLNMEMPLVAYGHAGYPLLMFPTAAADYLEYERFYLVDAIKYFIENGLIRAYSINSVNKYSLLNRQSHPAWKVEMLSRYDRYIMDEVLPLIRNECGDDAKPLTTGASLGAFLAANTYFKHSDNFRGTIAMSGSYDIYNYLESFYDENVYFNNPMMYLKNLNDDFHLPRLRNADSIVIVDRTRLVRSTRPQPRIFRASSFKRHPALARRLGTRRKSRLGLVAQDASLLSRKIHKLI